MVPEQRRAKIPRHSISRQPSRTTRKRSFSCHGIWKVGRISCTRCRTPGFNNALICAHESLHALISAKRAKAIYYSDLECRYGERVFDEWNRKILEFAPTVCIYLGEPFLPRLYLAKKSGAGCRIGFQLRKLLPLPELEPHARTSPAKRLSSASITG